MQQLFYWLAQSITLIGFTIFISFYILKIIKFYCKNGIFFFFLFLICLFLIVTLFCMIYVPMYHMSYFYINLGYLYIYIYLIINFILLFYTVESELAKIFLLLLKVFSILIFLILVCQLDFFLMYETYLEDEWPNISHYDSKEVIVLRNFRILYKCDLLSAFILFVCSLLFPFPLYIFFIKNKILNFFLSRFKYHILVFYYAIVLWPLMWKFDGCPFLEYPRILSPVILFNFLIFKLLMHFNRFTLRMYIFLFIICIILTIGIFFFLYYSVVYFY